MATIEAKLNKKTNRYTTKRNNKNTKILSVLVIGIIAMSLQFEGYNKANKKPLEVEASNTPVYTFDSEIIDSIASNYDIDEITAYSEHIEELNIQRDEKAKAEELARIERQKTLMTKAMPTVKRIDKTRWDTAVKVAKRYEGVEAEHILAICLVEGCGNPGALNDNGEYSIGEFQINMNAGSGRYNLTHNGMKMPECAANFECAADWTANNIANQYCKWDMSQNNGKIGGWISCLSQHNGAVPNSYYPERIEKYGLQLGLTY